MTRTLVAVAVASLLLLAGPAVAQTPPADPWKEIETLLSEDRLKDAAEAAARVREAAQKAGNEGDWMRGLIQETQLRTAVSGVEEAYRVLKGAEWPRGPVERAILHLYTAELLQAYNQQFSWRIAQRERIEGPEEEGGVLDLERATRGEIYATLLAEAAEAWSLREQLSAVPLDRVHRYVIPNEFPDEVRGTLRDAVSYLIAEVLADSAFWSVEEAQDLPRADLARLIDGSVDAAPADAAVHPLARMAAVLGDLEAWHAASGHRAATLEARRERLRLLQEHFDEPEDRQLLRRDLEERLAAFRDVSWWAMGMATLADFVRQEGDLAEARRIAREGAAAWPDTVAGASSLALAEEIEAPSFDLSAMGSDGLGRRSLLVRHKNLPELRFRAYAVDLKARLSREEGWWQIFPHLHEIKGATPVAEWRTELPPTPDFEFHQTYVTPPIDRPGAYLVVATPFPEAKDPDERESQVAAVGIILGDLVLSSQTGAGASEITALSGSTGEPIPGVQIQVLSWSRRNGAQAQKTLVTGPEGRLRIPQEAHEPAAVLAWKGEEVAYTRTSLVYESSEPGVAALFLTDRAIYRPQQTVFWKVLVYRRQAGEEPAIARGREIAIRLIDPNGQEVASRRFTTNEFGTAAGSFVIPPGRPLGSWRAPAARCSSRWRSTSGRRSR